MDGKTTFTNFQVDKLNQPLLYKLTKLRRNLNKNFKYYDIRKIDVDYDKHKNFYKYMKELAYLKYRRKHLVKIFRNYYFNIFTIKELSDIKRRNSHPHPYHEKTYHRLIYRNLYNYQFKPYVLPLKKEDKVNILNLTDGQMKRRKNKKRKFVNKYLDKKIKYLNKINQRLKNKNNQNERNKIKKEQPTILQKSNSTSCLNNNKYLLNNNYGSYKYFNLLPKIKNDKRNFNSIDNNLNEENNDNINTIPKPFKYRKYKLLLPKIKDDCLSTINTSKKLENDLKVFKYGKKEPQKKDKNIDENNLLNVPPRKLFKLFFGMNKSKPKEINKKGKTNKPKEIIKKEKGNKSLFFKAENNNKSENNIKEINEVKIEKESINDISEIKDNSNNSILNETNDKKIFSFSE